jgi:hypothetical protein
MNGEAQTRTLEEWLRAAYAGCPPPEAFLEADPAARRRLDEHAEGCPACAAERELARLFTAGPDEGVRPEDMGFVVARLEEASPLRRTAAPAPAAGRVVPFPSRAPQPAAAPPRRSSRWPAWLAAAAVVILAAGLFWQRAQVAPPLPEPPGSNGVMRGGDVELLAPVGEVPAAPAELRWEPRPGAAAYHVRLRAFDDELLWETTVAAPPARLPAAVAGRLQPAVTYSWSVEALDTRGARLAGSEPVRFRLRPGL